jgi:hypothetical protein
MKVDFQLGEERLSRLLQAVDVIPASDDSLTAA